MNFITVHNGPVALNVAVAGKGPLILCVHGFPELWYSWRHQLAHFTTRGYRVAAIDVRGYGASGRPHPIAQYTMRQLASDVAAVADALGGGEAILFGHDWGAPIVWNTALLHPDKIKAVAGLSVPYFPPAETSFLDAARAIYKDRFFYQLYFQEEGVAEAELEADVRTSLRKLYYAASGDAPQGGWGAEKGAGAKLLDGMIDPQPFPAWMSEADLRVFVDAFEGSGFRGPLNRYRAQTLDVAELADHRGRQITPPSFFVAGERDLVRGFIPGVDLYETPGAACADFRGKVIIPGIGHWVQQEAPEATNTALEGFLSGL
jgi:pimeloyl-ACP methyl ester carboxylesterase